MSKPATVLYRGRATEAEKVFGHLPPDGRVVGYMVTQEFSGAALWKERWGAEAEFVDFFRGPMVAIENAVRLTDALRGVPIMAKVAA